VKEWRIDLRFEASASAREAVGTSDVKGRLACDARMWVRNLAPHEIIDKQGIEACQLEL
jgi:hypothetical protein